MANTEQIRQMAEYRRQLRLNTLQNLNNKSTQTKPTAPQMAEAPQAPSSDAGFFERAGETLLDVGGNVSKGVVKSLEGIYDTGVGFVGAVGGWFSDDFEKKVKDHVAIDATENAFAWLNEVADDSYINEMGETGQNIVRGVAQGVGGMLPSIAITAATGGLGAPAAVAQGLGMGAFALGAAGQSTEEAIKGGAELGNAMLYGAAAGAVETGIEALSGFVPWDNMLIGGAKGAGKTLIKSGAKSGLGKAASMFLSEGAEEVASDIVNPALKRITGVDDEATIDFKQLPETFLIGGLTGLTMGGAGRVANNLKYNKEGGSKFVSMAEEMDAIRENEAKLAQFQENKKHTAEQVEDFSKRVDTDNYESIQRISETLKSLPANKRGNAFLTAPELHNIFEANGEIKTDVKKNFESVSNMNVSAGIRHQTENLNKVLADVNARNNTKFKLDTDALNETERTTFAKVTNAVSRLAESSKYKAFAGLDVAIIKNNKKANAFIKDGVLYLSREHLSSGEWAKHVAHEVTHFTEGSQEYNDFASFLTEDTEAVDRAAEAIAKQGYGFTADDVKYVLRKAQSGEKLNAREQEAYSELVSHIAEEILGNEDSIARLTAKNKSLANRIYERIKSFIKAFKGTNADKETVARLRKAEQLFAKALENTGKEKANQLYNQAVKTLKTAPQFSIKSINGENVVFIDTDQDIFDGADVKEYPKIAQKYMLNKFRGKVFPVGTSSAYVNKDGIGEYTHPANRRINSETRETKFKAGTELDNLLAVAEYVGHENDDGRHPEAVRGWDKYKTKFTFDGKNIFEGEISIELIARGDLFYDLTKIKNTSAVSAVDTANSKSTSDKGVLTTSNITQDAEDVNTKSQKNQKNISEAEKFSRKDSQGNELTEAQAEYFKDSKVRDEDGNLLVVYHGSGNQFNEFLHRYMGLNGNAHGRGFYFTEDKSYAEGYKKENGQLLEGYLNISKPVSETKVTISKSNLVKLIKATCEYSAKEWVEDGEYDSVKDALLDTWVSNYVNTYDVYDMNSVYRQVAEIIYKDNNNDVDILAELTNAGAGLKTTLSLARKTLGYDGIIFDNGNGTHQFVSFESNQFKNISNKAPTSSSDIRFSRKETLDNSNNKQYNKNVESKGGNFNERSNEFRRIQEESLSMSKAELQSFRNGSKKLDDKLRNRLGLVFRKEIHSIRIGSGNSLRVLKNTGEYLLYENVNASLFHDCFEIVRQYLRFGELVDLHEVKTTEDGIGYEDCINYLSEDGLSGFSITPSGDLISVFNASGKGKFLKAISEIVNKNTKTLDCYISPKQPLSDMYSKYFGFKTASIMDYNMEYDHDDIAKNHGMPQVAFMVNTEKEVVTKHFNKDQYDEAVEYQQSFIMDSLRMSRKKKSTPQAQTNVRLSVPQQQQSTKQKIATSATDTWLNAQIHFTDEQAGIIKEAKRLGVKDMDAKVNFVRASYNAAQSMLETSQRNIKGEKVGKSFKEIWDDVYKKGDEYRSDFYMYLMNYHNIDRIAVDKDLIANTTAADSRKEIARLNKLHPEFEEMAKDVWNYNKNLMQLRVDMGLVTAEQAEYMNKMYPHYVPAFRAEEGNNGVGGLSGKYNVSVKQTIKTAKGSTKDILPPDVIIARQTMELMRAGRVNMLANELYEAALNSNDFTNVSAVEILQRWQPNRTNKQLKLDRKKANEILEMMDEDYLQKEKKPNQITFYRGKEKITMAVTPEIFVGFEAFSPNTEYRNTLLNLVTGGNNVFKKLVTSANPFFLVRNFFRDLQDAAFYTKHGARLAPAIGRAYKEIATNGEMWQKYLAAGGLSAGMFDYNTGIKRYTGAKAVYNKVIGKLEWANMIVEQAPRLAEFMLSMNKGASIEQALLDSAEVTTNFSRGGKFAKFLNRTVMPFLNPSIQGWSKLYRTVTGRKSVRLWMELIFKCLILGILPTALNDLLMGDDEEYESLNIRDKENYYLFKMGDTFLKLPKGRVLSVFGSLYLRGKESAKGNKNAWDGYLQSVASAVSPIDSFTRTIFSPITDAATNTTWYGGEIEGRRLQNLAPEDRYDEGTSSIAIFLGRTFNYSPKKIHYIIDQYSGVIGDVVLPLTTAKAEKGIIAGNFTIDPTLSNRYSNDFYTALDEATFAKNAGDINATYVTRYLNSVAGEVSDMYATKREIENSKKSDKDKKAEIKTIQALINATNKSALEGAKVLETALKQINVEQQNKLLQQNRNFQKLDEAAQKKAIQKLNDYYYELAISKAFGTELPSKYAKYSQFDTSLFVYLTEIADITSDKDKEGNTIAGSRKAKIITYLKGKSITGSKQEAILNILGYTNN